MQAASDDSEAVGGPPASGQHSLLIAIGVFLAIAVGVISRIPTGPQLALDNDWGHQLAGANQILFGEHPFIDWHNDYGPLTFYASAAGQVLSGNRPLGEIILCLGGYILGYWLLYLASLKLTRSSVGSFAAVLLALVIMPRPYKYYVVLCPGLVIYCMVFYAEKASRGRLWLLAFAIALSGLFRADLGVYAFLGSAVTVALAGGFPAVLELLAASLVWCSPWFLFAVSRGALGTYLFDSTVGASRHAKGQSLPLPTGGWELVLYGLVFLLPPALIGWLLSKRPRETGFRASLWGLGIFAALMLLQSVHRAGYHHLVQACPVCFVIVALGLAHARRFPARPSSLLALGWAVLTLLAGVILFPISLATPRADLTGIAEDIAIFSLPRNDYLHHVFLHPQELGPNGPALKQILRDTKESDRILALPLLTNYNYLTGRPFGGGQMLLMNGYFSTPRDQQRMIESMEEHPVKMILIEPDLELDNMPSRKIRAYAPLLQNYFDTHYNRVAQYGQIEVLVRRGQ